jgi:stage III sporulation protein AH
MLSLVVVLSVYYITSPTANGDSTALKQVSDQDLTKKSNDANPVKVTTKDATDEVFEAMRMDVQAERDQLKEDLGTKAASNDLTSSEKNDAFDAMQQLTQLSTKENLIETMIKSLGYADAFVHADGEQVKVTVKSKESSKTAANDIIQLAKSELGMTKVVFVEFQKEK